MKNRRPKDPLTPHQVAALTSVVTRHQSSVLPTPLLSSPHQMQCTPRPVPIQRNTHRNYASPQSSVSCQRQNPTQVTPLLPNYRPNVEQNAKTNPILQRLFQAQQRQQCVCLFIYSNKSFSRSYF